MSAQENSNPKKAWAQAGSELKSVVGQLKNRLKEGKPEFPDAKAAGNKLIDARSKEELKEAASFIAQQTSSTVKDISGTVQRAVGETKDSEAFKNAREAVSEALQSSKETVQDKVENLRERREQKSGPQGKEGNPYPPTIDGEVIDERIVEEDR